MMPAGEVAVSRRRMRRASGVDGEGVVAGPTTATKKTKMEAGWMRRDDWMGRE